MISWVELDPQGQVKEFSGRLDIDAIKQMIKDPFWLLHQDAQQVGRTHRGEPELVFSWQPHQRFLLTDQTLEIQTGHTTRKLPSKQFWEHIRASRLVITAIPKIRSYLGYYGYLSYEISRLLEHYQHRHDDPVHPYLILELPTRYLVSSSDRFLYIELDLEPVPDIRLTTEVELKHNSLEHSTDYPRYISDVETIIDHIRRGDIYQANYTQQFRLPRQNQDLATLYSSIRQRQALPYAAYLQFDQLTILSLSPELFLEVKNGVVTTKPIKGTRPRGKTEQEDQQLVSQLQGSTKDHAELAMIVDLLRNDLGKSAIAGSVEVVAHAQVESYENVHHLVSTVRGGINPNFDDSWRLLLRALPGGSISGVPKFRSLEIIDQHELVTREIYTGIIGYLGLDGDMEFNIAIRTAVATNQSITFNAGGGIVYDSDPVDEYLESLHKAKHLMSYFGKQFSGHLLMLDGEFHHADHVFYQIGTQGVFETIMVDNGQIMRLDDHLQRLERGLTYYQMEVQLPTTGQLYRLIDLNLANQGFHRLNIYIWGEPEIRVVVRVQPYQRPTGEIKLVVGRTIQVPEPIKQGLKSLEYEQYRAATQEAIEHDCWDMILQDQDTLILEGGRSTLYFLYQGSWVTPANNVVEGTGRSLLLDQGVVATDISHEVMLESTAIAVGNALIGLLPVSSIVDYNTTIWSSAEPNALPGSSQIN